MATSKRKSKKSSSKSSSKKGASKKSAPVSDMDDLFSGTPAGKSSKSKPKKDSAQLPDDLKESCDIFVSSKVVTKAVESKGKLAENRIKEYAIDEWCGKFVEDGTRPLTCTYHGNDTQFDFIQTKRIDMSPNKLKGLQMIGFDPLEENDEGEKRYVTLSGMHIDLEAVRKAGGKEFQDKMKAALGKVFRDHAKEKIGGEEETLEMQQLAAVLAKETLIPIVRFKDNFLDNLLNVVKEFTGVKLTDKTSKSRKKEIKDKLRDKLKDVMEVLAPRTQVRNATSSASDEECFTFVVDTDFGGK